MKQIGNLAIICASKNDVLFQLLDGQVTVYVGQGPARTSMSAHWADDTKINNMIYELNFGRCAETEMRRAA